MLMRFEVKNFLSFDNMTEFSMFAGDFQKKQEHLIKTKKTNLVKFAAFYGANASGKSNLVKAIDYSRKIILEGIKRIPRETFFKCKPENKNKITTFEYEILLNDKYYAYGFNVLISKNEIVGEWLYDISGKEEKLIFERDLENNQFNKDVEFSKEINERRFDVYFEDNKLNSETLFLKEISRFLYNTNHEFRVFEEIYKWFSNCLDVNFPSIPITHFEYMLSNDVNFNKEVIDILNSFGTGITDFELIECPMEDLMKELPEMLINRIKDDLLKSKSKGVNIRGNKQFYNITLDKNNNLKAQILSFKHQMNAVDFYLSEESDGTRRLMDLIEILLSKDKVFIIDEIDRSLHPNLTYKFIELFLNIAKERNIQLIVTTHEDKLLDLRLLRRDEIWFIQKDNLGKTEIYPLESFDKKFDTKIIKSYLEGRYGGIPRLKKINIQELNKIYDGIEY